MGKYIQPGFDGFQGYVGFPVLFRIYVTVPAAEVAFGENVKKKIGGIF
jgi:hypothetical protein